MFVTPELLERYGALKAAAEEKEAIRVRREREFKETLKAELEAEFGAPETELEALRDKLKEEIPLGKSVAIDGVGEVKYEARTLSWDVNDLNAFAEWAVNNGRAKDLLDVKKSKVNTVCNAAKLGGFGVPAGVEPRITKVLEVKIFDRP